MIGGKLGHYQILAKLGEGGMGVVYLAEDDRLRRKVALKMLPPGLAADPQRLSRFEREVKTVAALNHPNIVTIHSVEEVDDRRFFTMEHIEGRTLAQMIPLDGLPLVEFLKIAVPLAEALTAAHARGIQHRDLKPSNVMVTADGRVKVLDFGLAKLKESDRTEAFEFKPETTLTQAGLAIGTLAYMSPEQLRMLPTDHRSDIFSLGVVLYEMATGRGPFLGQSTAEVISSILRDQPARVYEHADGVPDELDAILRKCLDKEPAKRWQTAAELKDALAEVATDVSLTRSAARARSAAKAAGTGAGPGRRALVVGAAIAIALLGGFALWKMRGRNAAGNAVAAAPLPANVAARAVLPSVVVLPLTSFSGEPEYFVDGITDALIASLARIEGLRVISRQSAMHFKGSQKLLPEIARELGVEYVVEGSVARAGENVRLNAQVIRADPETTLWSNSFERRAEEVLALQSSFATAVADAIHVQLSPTEQSRMAEVRSVAPAAYEAYLQGRFWSGKHSQENFRRAQGYFERAIAIDPEFAAAWAGLANIHQKQGYFFEELAPRLVKAESAVRRALELDPQSSDAHAALGDLEQARWNWKDAEREIRRAIELEPGSASGHLNFWRLLMRLRRFDEATREIALARSLDPLSANIAANQGLQLGLAGRYDDAFALFSTAQELDPDFTLVHTYAWFFNHRLGRDPQRGDELRGAFRSYGFDDLVPEYDRHLAADGYEKTLSWLAHRLDGMKDDPRAQLGLVAGLLACAGDEERAMAWLERGYAAHAWEMGWLATTPDLDSLHRRADFRALVAKVGLPLPPV